MSRSLSLALGLVLFAVGASAAPRAETLAQKHIQEYLVRGTTVFADGYRIVGDSQRQEMDRAGQVKPAREIEIVKVPKTREGELQFAPGARVGLASGASIPLLTGEMPVGSVSRTFALESGRLQLVTSYRVTSSAGNHPFLKNREFYKEAGRDARARNARGQFQRGPSPMVEYWASTLKGASQVPGVLSTTGQALADRLQGQVTTTAAPAKVQTPPPASGVGRVADRVMDVVHEVSAHGVRAGVRQAGHQLRDGARGLGRRVLDRARQAVGGQRK
jgi:hypothetical protein